MDKVFIVAGSCGEYSDYTEWPIVAYSTEKAAREHSDKAQISANKINAAAQDIDYGISDRYQKIESLLKTNKYDLEMRQDYGETHYGVYEVEFRE